MAGELARHFLTSRGDLSLRPPNHRTCEYHHTSKCIFNLSYRVAIALKCFTLAKIFFTNINPTNIVFKFYLGKVGRVRRK